MKTTAELEAAIHEIRSDVMSEYIPPAKITQLVKGALRKAFPDSTFRVSTRHGIQVEWHDDGPTVEQVQNALLGAKLATAEHGRDGRPWLNGPGCMSYRLDRFNPAKREADKADLERRMQEAQAQRLREEEAVRKAVTAKRTAVATDTRPIVSEPLSDPAVFAVFEELRQRAEVDVSISSEAERQRRPSWAPPLIIEGELLEACRELGYLSADAKPIVRLWTQFADPKKKSAALREQRSNHPLAGIACRGFELHVGSERGPSASILFEAQRAQSGEWRFGPTGYTPYYNPYYGSRYREWHELICKREHAIDPSEIDKLTREIAEIDAKDLEDQRAQQRRDGLRQRVIELARARVLEFAGAPGLQMQAASRLWGHCFNCGKELIDPISLERGIGPDCLVGKVEYIQSLAPYLGREWPGLIPPTIVTVERIAFVSAMPLEFVQTTINEMPVDAQGRRTKPEKKQPKPIDEADAMLVVLHSAVFGTSKTIVREFRIGEVKPYAQYPVSVHISFVEPRKRSWSGYTIVPDNLQYATLEHHGEVLFDSREAVPCDMAKWTTTYRKHREQWLARQAEIDKENASARGGVITMQMGNFSD